MNQRSQQAIALIAALMLGLVVWISSLPGFLSPSEVVTNGPDEWNTFDITLVGRLVTVVVNGKTVISEQGTQAPPAARWTAMRAPRVRFCYRATIAQSSIAISC
jgi:hypothetical protein